MFWKKKEKFDRVQTYLDKAGITDGAEKKLEWIQSVDFDLLDICGKEGNSMVVLAQMTGDGENCFFYCDPETQSQKDRIREVCIETGIRFEVEKDVDMDLPEEERLPQKWSVKMPAKHWKKLTCLFMRELFGTEEFEIVIPQ